MSSRRIVEIPVKVPLGPDEGPRIELVCDWEKELYPDTRQGYRVQFVTVSPGKELSEESDRRDHAKLSDALRDCAKRVEALERKGYR